MRSDGRLDEQLRPTRITPNYLVHAEGSVLVESGKTKLICTASVEDRVPPFRRNSGKGWVTAEYGMLPRATSTRTQRESSAGRVGGRTQEIQRLIGRSLRAVTKMEELGERTITLDCDVIQADGGTRTASITGAFVALALAIKKMREQDLIRTMPIVDYVAATSVGIVEGMPMLDLAYVEDSKADVDMNIIKTGAGLYIEVQGTAEAMPFGREALNRLLDLADTGIRPLIALPRGLGGNILGEEGRAPLVATADPGKLREVQRLMSGVAIRLASLADLPPIEEPEETGTTFEENARLKARYYAARSGLWTVAEDSGLVIDALGGEPGVRSARYLRVNATYPERFVDIYRRLDAQPNAPRSARFVAALASVEDGQLNYETTGI